MTHLHPHNYTIEGLQYLMGRQERSALGEPVREAVGFIFERCLDPAGRVVQAWSESGDLDIAGIRSDVLAQSLRSYYAAKLLDDGAVWSWESRIPELFARMETYTLDSGGTAYGEDEYGQKTRHANAWCHFFNTEMRIFKMTYETGAPWDPHRIIIT